MSNYSRGKIAEFVARMYMRLHGYRIVAQNFTTGRGTTAGEVDFIACRAHTLVFVEVKKRKTVAEAAYAISKQQQQRIIRGAQSFLKQNPQYNDYDMRFDAILVVFPWYIEHLKNAWGINF